MSNLRKTPWNVSLILGAILAFSNGTVAAEIPEVNTLTSLGDPDSTQIAQITSVSELSDFYHLIGPTQHCNASSKNMAAWRGIPIVVLAVTGQ